MNLKYRVTIIKIGLFFFSLLTFLLLVEISIRLYVVNLNSSETFVADHMTNQRTIKSELANDYDRNFTFEFFPSKSDSEIVAVGDSFTNGGNISTKDTYPYQLYLNFSKNITVRNMGECESTSKKVLENIESFYNSTHYDDNKNYIFVVLTGVADLMNQSKSISFNNRNSPTEQTFAHKDVRKFISYNGILSHLKSIQFLQYFYGRLFSLNNTSYIHNQEAYDIIRNCSDLSNSQRIDCYFKHLRNFNSFEVHEPVISNLFTISDIDNSLNYSQRINYIFDYLNLFGHIVPKENFNDLIFEVSLFYYQLQSQISSDDMIEKISLVSSKNSNKLDQLNFDQFKFWVNNSSRVKANLFQAFDSILSLTKKHSDKILLATYPLEYEVVNSNIREYSVRHGIPLIDLEKAFKMYDISKLIQDGEHCNRKGYKLMADEIYKILYSLK